MKLRFLRGRSGFGLRVTRNTLGACEGGLVLNVRFYMKPETSEPHFAKHGLDESEVQQVLVHPLEDRPGEDGARVALGRTDAGRYIRVVYVTDPEPDSVFVITAYEIGPKARQALMRRLRRKP